MAKLIIKNPNEIMHYLKENKIPFLLEQTMFTKTIHAQGIEYYYIDSTTDIKKPDLGFIGMVKKHCEKLINIPVIDREFINYIQPNINFKKSYKLKKNIFEIDLTGAYWEFAKENNYLNENIYKRGLEVKKKVRLIALGNLAKRTAEIKFDGYFFTPVNFRRSEKTENIFFHVSELTDLLMRRLIVLAGKDFLFYWCDAIFIKDEIAFNRIINYLEGEGIKFKSRKLNAIIRQENKITTFDDDHINNKIDPKTGKEKNPEGKRVFNFRKNNLLTLFKKPKNKKGNAKTNN